MSHPVNINHDHCYDCQEAPPMFEILYPERRAVTREWILSQAKDALANDYMERNPGAEDAAIEENSRVSNLGDAMDILSDLGLVTFTQTARDDAS